MAWVFDILVIITYDVLLIDIREKRELGKIRRRTSDYRSERTLRVIMNSEGGNPVQIAKNLKRSYFTVRKWLLSFKKKREEKYKRRYSRKSS